MRSFQEKSYWLTNRSCGCSSLLDDKTVGLVRVACSSGSARNVSLFKSVLAQTDFAFDMPVQSIDSGWFRFQRTVDSRINFDRAGNSKLPR